MNSPQGGSTAPSQEFSRPRRYMPAIGFAVGLGLVVWFGLLSRFPEPSVGLVPIRFDLAEHVVAFCWLSFTGLFAWKRTWAVVIGLILAAGLLELMQTMGSLHEAHLVDWAASTVGVVFGWGLGVGLRCILARWRVFAVQGGTP